MDKEEIEIIRKSNLFSDATIDSKQDYKKHLQPIMIPLLNNNVYKRHLSLNESVEYPMKSGRSCIAFSDENSSTRNRKAMKSINYGDDINSMKDVVLDEYKPYADLMMNERNMVDLNHINIKNNDIHAKSFNNDHDSINDGRVSDTEVYPISEDSHIYTSLDDCKEYTIGEDCKICSMTYIQDETQLFKFCKDNPEKVCAILLEYKKQENENVARMIFEKLMICDYFKIMVENKKKVFIKKSAGLEIAMALSHDKIVSLKNRLGGVIDSLMVRVMNVTDYVSCITESNNKIFLQYKNNVTSLESQIAAQEYTITYLNDSNDNFKVDNGLFTSFCSIIPFYIKNIVLNMDRIKTVRDNLMKNVDGQRTETRRFTQTLMDLVSNIKMN